MGFDWLAGPVIFPSSPPLDFQGSSPEPASTWRWSQAVGSALASLGTFKPLMPVPSPRDSGCLHWDGAWVQNLPR